MIIKGVDRYRVMDPWFEGTQVVLSFRGEPYSPEYIQGISGAGFRIAGICPCAPTCSFAMDPPKWCSRQLGTMWYHVPMHGDRRKACPSVFAYEH